MQIYCMGDGDRKIPSPNTFVRTPRSIAYPILREVATLLARHGYDSCTLPPSIEQVWLSLQQQARCGGGDQ